MQNIAHIQLEYSSHNNKQCCKYCSIFWKEMTNSFRFTFSVGDVHNMY